ncbi:MAG: RIP metalloprotease RseP [Nitrospirae bacterium]|nr:RIP metalloprotease RseP [Nitrospirota bacterium]
MQSIFAFVFVLGILVFFHELGHFLIARRIGVKVLKFSLGFGPKLVGRKIGETEYLISSVPLGGYVKLLGEDPTEEMSPEDKGRSFSDQPVGKRIAIVMAGPLFNLILAALIFVFLFMVGIPLLTTEIGDVIGDSPAMKAGVLPGDKIVAINGKEISLWDEMKEIIEKNRDQAMTFTVRRGDNRIDLKITPMVVDDENPLKEKVRVGRIGVRPKGTFITKRYNPVSAVMLGIERTWNITALTVLGIIKIFQREIPADTIGGPILILQMAGQQASEGFVNIMLFIAILSINLGVINLFPIPILDGGHVLFFLIEAVMGKPVSIKKREVAQQIGLFLLVSLMLFAFYNDIMRFFIKQ